MRGGTSKGPFYKAADLPSDKALRDKVLLAAMGSPDKRQIDGLGGAHPLTSKVGIVSQSTVPGVALDFLFAQLQPDNDTVDTTPNCGNMLAAVVPFALETGMLQVQGDQTTFRVLTLNTNMQCDITVDTTGGMVQYEGKARIDGAPGTSAPVVINFRHRRFSLLWLVANRQGQRHLDSDRSRFCPLHFGRDLHRQRHAPGDIQGL
jgi:4-oxalomesaconate tautomerase